MCQLLSSCLPKSIAVSHSGELSVLVKPFAILLLCLRSILYVTLVAIPSIAFGVCAFAICAFAICAFAIVALAILLLDPVVRRTIRLACSASSTGSGSGSVSGGSGGVLFIPARTPR